MCVCVLFICKYINNWYTEIYWYGVRKCFSSFLKTINHFGCKEYITMNFSLETDSMFIIEELHLLQVILSFIYFFVVIFK